MVAPGIWRNICPLAASNQTPRVLGITKALKPPKWLQEYGYVIAITLFVAFVALRKLGLDDSIRFLGHTPARQAFAHGRQMVVPSRADSLPYAVIEAGGAGIPIIASGVGGIPEILGPDGITVPPEDSARLAGAIAAALDDPARAKAGAANLRQRIGAQFSADAMVEGVLAGYGAAIGAKFIHSH